MIKFNDDMESNLLFKTSSEKYNNLSKLHITTPNYKTRLTIFVVLNVIGYILQFGSIAALIKSILTLNPFNLAFYYTLGNVLSLTGSFVLFGVQDQYNKIIDPSRVKISMIFFGSLFLCLFIPMMSKGWISSIIVLCLIIVQIIFYWVYTLSLFPKIKSMVVSTVTVISKLFKF